MSANSQLKHSSHQLNAVDSDKVTEYLKYDERRSMVRYITGIVSSITAVIYFLIGFNLLIVLEFDRSQMFGIFAGVAYAFGALTLFAVKNRALWIFGAVFQMFVIYTYFSLAPQRLPEFEIWGIILGIMQALILFGLFYLIVRSPRQA